MKIGMFLHRLASPRPRSPSFARTIPATVSPRPGKIGLVFYAPQDYQLRRLGGWRFPIVINFHGGGFTIGTATDDSRWATEVVCQVDAVVVSVSYRLAPAHPFPTAVEDGLDAILYLAERADELGLDLERVVLSGFSAGGNLAFTVPMRFHDQIQRLRNTDSPGGGRAESLRRLEVEKLNSIKIVAIISWYPPTDFTTSTAIRRATCTRPQQAMPSFFVDLFDAAYICPPGSTTWNPLLSPGVAADELLRVLPDNIVLFTCEWDMLRAEAERFGSRLKRDIRKNVTQTMIPEVAHAWDKAPNPLSVDKAVALYYAEACAALKRFLEKRVLEEC